MWVWRNRCIRFKPNLLALDNAGYWRQAVTPHGGHFAAIFLPWVGTSLVWPSSHVFIWSAHRRERPAATIIWDACSDWRSRRHFVSTFRRGLITELKTPIPTSLRLVLISCSKWLAVMRTFSFTALFIELCNCSRQPEHSVVRPPRCGVSDQDPCIYMQICVTEETSRIPTLQVRLLCSFCWILPILVCCS